MRGAANALAFGVVCVLSSGCGASSPQTLPVACHVARTACGVIERACDLVPTAGGYAGE